MGSSVGVFRDGKPVFCIEEERLTRVKNWMGIPETAINYLLSENIVDPREVDAIGLCGSKYSPISRGSFYRKYAVNFQRAHGFDTAIDHLVDLSKIAITKSPLFHLYKARKNINSLDEESFLEDLGFNRSKFFRLDHHYCHAAAAYFGLARSLEEEYLVFTLDGGGDGLKATIWKSVNGKLEKLKDDGGFSIGNMFSALTYFLGFTPHEHEYKLMGLAPYVNPVYSGEYKKYFAKFLSLEDDDLCFTNPLPLDYTKFFKHLLQDLPRDRFDNIAAGLQAFLEEILIRWIRGGIKKYGINRVLCSGGVFMNVKLNMLLSRLPEVSAINVFPSCGDESNIFGAAFHLHNELFSPKCQALETYCLGIEPDRDLEEALIKHKNSISYQQIDDPNDYIAGQLAANKIVARCSGKMEFGARALGNRSILANPSDLANINKINRAIKNRDFWMPFAPAILWDKADEILEVPASLRETGSPYMMFAFDSRPANRQNLICGLHMADYSARAQTVDPERYPDLYEIIHGFYTRTGIPGVLNTSFNLHGYPIVESSSNAIEVLLKSDIDVLVINNWAIEKNSS